MSRYVVISDFDLTDIGTKFDLEGIRDYVDSTTGEILGHYYDVKALDGRLKKKLLTVRVNGYNREITNDDIYKYEQVVVTFEGIEVSSVQARRMEGLRVFYIAKKMIVEEMIEMQK